MVSSTNFKRIIIIITVTVLIFSFIYLPLFGWFTIILIYHHFIGFICTRSCTSYIT